MIETRNQDVPSHACWPYWQVATRTKNLGPKRGAAATARSVLLVAAATAFQEERASSPHKKQQVFKDGFLSTYLLELLMDHRMTCEEMVKAPGCAHHVSPATVLTLVTFEPGVLVPSNVLCL